MSMPLGRWGHRYPGSELHPALSHTLARVPAGADEGVGCGYAGRVAVWVVNRLAE